MKKRSYSKFIDPYIEHVENGGLLVCEDIRLLIKNIVRPVLNRKDIIIDDDVIEKGLSLQKYFPYKLIEWEVFLFALIVGVFDTHKRIWFDDIQIIIGRGSGKNGFISFLCFYFLSDYHGVKHYDIDIIANMEKQAMVSFNDVYEVIKDPIDAKYEAALSANFYANKVEITNKITKSILRYNTSSKKGKDSKRTGCVIMDEVHEYEDYEKINTLVSGLGKVENSRQIAITTDGHVRGGVIDAMKDKAKTILSKKNAQCRTLIFWCHLESEDEVKEPKNWIKAIPSINEFDSLARRIKKEWNEMAFNISYYPEFMAKRMNHPIGNKDVEVASWEDILATNVKYPCTEGWECVGSVDYAKTNDFVGVGLLFKKGNIRIFKKHGFVCRKSRDLPGIKAPLKEWEKLGLLTFVNDVEISAEIVVNWFVEQAPHCIIKKIAIDNFRYSFLNYAFKKIGFDAYEKKNIKLVRPSDLMKVATVINSVFINHWLVCGDDPFWRWNVNNTKVILRNGNIEYGKIEEHYRKTDMFMCYAAAMTIEDEIVEYVDLPMLDVISC